MNLTPVHKNEVMLRLAETVADALEQDMVTTEEVDALSPFVLENIDKIDTHEELIKFLRELSAKSPIFSYLLVTESGEVKQKEDEKVAGKAEGLLKSGQVDAALNIVKEANNNG